MSYNHRSAEKAWLKWKEAEEKELRALGMAEDAIQQLHTYDWNVFKAERNFRRWQCLSDEVPDTASNEIGLIDLTRAENLLFNAEDMRLFEAMKELDKSTVQMLLMQACGYSSRQIALKIGISEHAVNNRISRAKKKIKKIY